MAESLSFGEVTQYGFTMVAGPDHNAEQRTNLLWLESRGYIKGFEEDPNHNPPGGWLTAGSKFQIFTNGKRVGVAVRGLLAITNNKSITGETEEQQSSLFS